MGIKGIYGEIGSGKRVALGKLAVEKYEQTGRPLRLAIDISIWQFQIQSGRGGANPALRTLYYRLLRLLSLSIQPLFVFDGPNKPPLKRNKKTSANCDTLGNNLTKQLLRLFGFHFHTAPGEAEAECALFQRLGVVDAVLSEDVDTLMFGCGLTFRNWSCDQSKGNPPTHISVYDAEETKNRKSGLDREGMILIALMSGGDYDTEGIPGCGIKVACEAARAGFGRSLCDLSATDTVGLISWREELTREIQTNEHGYFRIKHRGLKIPPDFPDREVLSYYTNPAVSSRSELLKLSERVNWDAPVDVPALRKFVAEYFDWTFKSGAKKFLRQLAPALLVLKLRHQADRRSTQYEKDRDLLTIGMNERKLVKNVCGRRTHFSTDGMPELRLQYSPIDIVGIDLEAEEDGPEVSEVMIEGLSGEEFMVQEFSGSGGNMPDPRICSPPKRSNAAYDPMQLQKIWVPETIAKLGVPLTIEDYEESLRIATTSAQKKPSSRMAKGALDRYLTVRKPNTAVRKSQSAKVFDEKAYNREGSQATQLKGSGYHSVLSQQRPGGWTDRNRLWSTLESQLAQSHPKKPRASQAQARPIVFKGSFVKEPSPWALSQDPFRTTGKRTTKAVLPLKNERDKLTGTVASLDSQFSLEKLVDDAAQMLSTSRLLSTPFQSSRGAFLTSPLVCSDSAKEVTTGDEYGENFLSPEDALPSLEEIFKSQSACDLPQPHRKGDLLHGKSRESCDATESLLSCGKKSCVPGNDDFEPRPAENTQYEGEAHGKKYQEGKRFVIIRDSLEGSWKEMTGAEKDQMITKQEMTGHRRAKIWRESEVKVLDLTTT